MTNPVQPIRLENLLIDLQNPRYDARTDQRDAYRTIAQEQGMKLLSLAADIVDNGLNPCEHPIVTPTDDGSLFVVLEGNRRIAALRLMTDDQFRDSLVLPRRLCDRFKELRQRAVSLPSDIACAVLPREKATHWIYLRHTGENEGRGVIGWDGLARHRFRSRRSPALQAIDMVRDAGFLRQVPKQMQDKIAITNIERILVTPAARSLLGVDVKNGELVLTASRDEALGRLALVVIDVASRAIKVTHLDSREQRVKYAQEVANRPLPTRGGAQPPAGATAGGATTSKAAGTRTTSYRSTLIPKRLRLAAKPIRIVRICGELQKLNVHAFTNSCAVMLRVLVEMCVHDYAGRHAISLRVPAKPNPRVPGRPQTREMSMRQVLDTIADSLEQTKRCTHEELYGIRTVASNRNHVLSVDSWHAYVHNLHFNPTAEELKTCWDNVQPFIEGLFKS